MLQRCIALLAVLALLFTTACEEKKTEEKASEKKTEASAEENGPKETSSQADPKEAETAKLTDEELTKLGETEVEGFERKSNRVASGNLSIFYQGTTPNEHGRHAAVQVTLGGCFVCEKMDVETWRANKENLTMMLSRATKEDPNLVFEIEALDLGAGKTGIYVYSRSYVETETPSGGKSRATNHGVTLYFNDSVNNLVINVSGRGKPGEMPESAEELATVFTKDEMLDATKKIFAAFAPTFS